MATHRVVARVDVDGDGRTDVVRLRKVEDQHAVLTVSTARGATLSRHLRTTWIDPMWHGAARIDGRPGAELVLITDAGAHTLFHTVLTFADGRLVRQQRKGPGRTWVTDGAAFVNIGWKRYRKDGRAFVAKRWVTEDYESPGWSGKSVTYRWGRGEWHRAATKSLPPPNGPESGSVRGLGSPGPASLSVTSGRYVELLKPAATRWTWRSGVVAPIRTNRDQ
jgi:hypothetical protein